MPEKPIMNQATEAKTADVLKAIEDAFHPEHVDAHLKEADGRVFGTVTVMGSALFTDLDDIRRQQLLWQQLRQALGPGSAQVGPVILEPTQRG